MLSQACAEQKEYRCEGVKVSQAETAFSIPRETAHGSSTMIAIVRIRATPALMLRSALLLGALLLGACSGGGSGGNSGGIPAINRSLIDGPITLTDGGAAKFYTVVLNSAPSADVSITLTTGSHVVVTPSTVTFTPATWNVSQDITVAAVDDAVADGAHSDVIVHHNNSTNSGYAALTLGDIQVDSAGD